MLHKNAGGYGDIYDEVMEDDEDVEEVDSSELDTEMDSSHMIHTE